MRSSPFRGPGLLARCLPFALVAILAESSLALPPGPKDYPATVISAALLAAVTGSFWLPWERLPSWTTVVPPLLYTGAVLALILATGSSASGVGIVVLAPLLWVALFHHQWESLCLVGATVAVEVITAVVPHELTASVIARRAVFWTMLGLLVSFGIHGLRDRALRAQAQAVRLQEELGAMALTQDRDRLSQELYGSIIHRLMGVGLHLAGSAELAKETPRVADRLHVAIGEVDVTIRTIREVVFDLTDTEGPTDLVEPDHAESSAHT